MIKLVFAGHTIRGGEIIKLLEMLGGKNTMGFKNTFMGFYYWINENNEIVTSDIPLQNSMVYLLEEFEKKYPYKVGDKVISHNKWEGAIVGMEWSNDDIIYHVRENNGFISHQSIEELQPYKEEKTFPPYMDYDIKTTKEQETIECSDKKHKGNYTIGYIQELGSKDMELIIPYNQEIVIENGRYILRDKKPKYPQNYKECCEVLMGKTNFQDFELVLIKLSTNINEENSISLEPPYINLINNFYKLLICRDAYWKIAGEEMGLDKPWEPDWTQQTTKYCIWNCKNKVDKYESTFANFMLTFPTKELRDTFYENFKDLIEQCKELL